MFEGVLQESLWNACPVDLELPSWVYCFSFFPPLKGSSHGNYSIPAALLSGGQKGELATQRVLNRYNPDLRPDVCKSGRACVSQNHQFKADKYIKMRLLRGGTGAFCFSNLASQVRTM